MTDAAVITITRPLATRTIYAQGRRPHKVRDVDTGRGDATARKLADARARAVRDVTAILDHAPVVLAFDDGSVLLCQVVGADPDDETRVAASFEWTRADQHGGRDAGSMGCTIRRGDLERAGHEYAAGASRRDADLRDVLASLRDSGEVPERARGLAPRWTGLLDWVFGQLADRRTGALNARGVEVLRNLEARK